MSCTDLFVASLAVSLGFYLGKDFVALLDKFPGPFPREWAKRIGWIIGCAILIAVVLYFGWMCDNTFLTL